MDIDDEILSEEEGFHEDALNDEDYDLLYELLPKVKESIATYNDSIDELSIKEAIYYNYFELEPTLEELRSRFPKKKEEPKMSKLAMLAKKRKEARSSDTPVDNTTPTPTKKQPSTSSGMSKLAALAKARKAEREATSNAPLETPKSQDPEKPKLIRKTNLAGLALKQKARAKQEGKVPEHIPEPPLPTPNETAKPKSSINYSLQVDEVDLLFSPEQSVSVFLFGDNLASLEPCPKRRRNNPELFYAYTNSVFTAKARSNFSSPSPDDVVLTAQKEAFESGMSKLTIDEKEKKESASDDKKAPAPTKPFKSIDFAKVVSSNPNFNKPNKSFVIIGHVDAGKSTLVGRILYDVGAVESKTMVKLVREAEKSNKGSFALAWIMDQTSEERSRGVTIDICATNFETPETRFTAIDAPGHKDFVPQMISGVSQADAALLVVDSINGEFETGFMMNGQTKEHTLLAKNLGIDQIIVAVNKMDKEDWDENRFKEIQEQLSTYLTSTEVGFKIEDISFIPLSGLTGYNVVKNDGSIKELAWYQGPTLLEALSKIESPDSETSSIQNIEKNDFNLAINDIFDITSSEFKVKGKINSGMIQPGQTVCLQPAEEYLQVQGVFIEQNAVDVAIARQSASLRFKTSQFRNMTVEDISIGDLVVSLDSPSKAVKRCTALVNMFNITKPLLVGTPFVMFRGNASVAARISKVNKINGVKKKKMHLVSNQIAEVEIEVIGDRALPLMRFSDRKALGRIVMRREGATVGAGIVTGL